MADIRCSHCGKNNPDFLDVCQFCQSPLKSESMLHIGEQPTKKDTGELESVLPDWLKNARQQARDSAQEESSFTPSQPKAKKEEPVDLLAGLFQSDATEDEDVPDWLTSINQNTTGTPPAPAAAAPQETESDFFAQFRQDQVGPTNEPAPETLAPRENEPLQPSQDSGERDELSEWFSQATEHPAEPFGLDHEASQVSSDWGIGDQAQYPAEASPAPKEEEDLRWLHDLETTARQTDELRAPKPQQDFGAPSTGSEQEDLSWLNNLGALPGAEPKPAQPMPPSEQQEDLSWLDSFKQTEEPSAPHASSEDLSWLDNLGTANPEPTSAESPAPAEDLSWLNALGETPATEPPAPTPASPREDLGWLDTLGGTPLEPTSSQSPKPEAKEELSWLSALGDTPGPQPSAADPEASSSDPDWLNLPGSPPSQEPTASSSPAQEDLSWLNSLQGGEPDALSSAPFAEPEEDENLADISPSNVSPFTPRKTAPLGAAAEDVMPDWLKSATEGPSMPMGVSALDQFRDDYQVPGHSEDAFPRQSLTPDAEPTKEQSSLESFFPEQDQPETASTEATTRSADHLSSAPSAEDVNSLFSIEMPDWLSQEEPTKQEDAAQPIGIHAEGGEALAPVDLPSWVQAMRPVDAVISEAAPNVDDQPAELEGPLAGFKGLIPVIPPGSARRPKPVTLKLQASDEQQTSAAILEQILAAETSPRPLVSTAEYASQRTLRWALAAVFLFVLGILIALRPNVFPPSAALTVESREIGARLQGVPARADVLVVVDYKPALAGEMEAVSAPMLEQLALLRHPRLSFVSTSPNGPALVERLMSNPAIRSTSDGLGGYVAGQDYYNLGYLPGSESGALTFIQSPKSALPSATVDVFSSYSAMIILTDNADSARIWIEQLQALKQRDAALALQPLLVASSAQAGPLLQPYLSSNQINGLIAGLPDASRYEYQNTSRPGIAVSYLDAFGGGLLMAVTLIVLGGAWGIVTGIRARRAETAEA